jgi:hypothetical protein
MVSAGTDSAKLFMASVICIGTRSMRRAAKRRSIVSLGFLGLGANENSAHGAVFSLRKSGRAAIRFLGGDRGSQAARAIRFAGIVGEAFDRHSDLRPCLSSAGHFILAIRPVVGYFWNCSASWPGMTRSGLPPASWIMRS